MTAVSRRTFLYGAGAAAGYLSAQPLFAARAKSPFKVSVISDEISQDFDHACSVIANDFGLGFVEIRAMWGKNLQTASDAEIAEALKILAKYDLQVTDIASPLFKVDWPDAPKSKFSPKHDNHGAEEIGYAQQDQVLERSVALAKQFKTDKIRCFDFWRLDDVKPHRPAINEKLRAAAEKARAQGVMLVIENEFECNTGTGREAAETLAGVKSENLALNWDPANAVRCGELDTFPKAWELLPKNRIHHCHCKNAVKTAGGEIDWSPVDKGIIDWPAQFRALQKAGYREAVSLETHWKSGGTPEASTRISWAGMKKNLQAANALQG